MHKNPKNKEGLRNNLLAFLKTQKCGEYLFPENTTLKMLYWEELKEHTMVMLKLMSKKSIEVTTIVDGNTEHDNLMEFCYSEIKHIHDMIIK